jgi:hypothetical protein
MHAGWCLHVMPRAEPLHRPFLRLGVLLCLGLPGAPGAKGQNAAPDLPPAPSAVQAGASVAGQVLSDDGAMVAGAAVELRSSAASTATTTTGNDGEFTFQHVPPGHWTLTVRLPGFTPAVQQVEVAPGQSLQLGPSVLHLASVAITVDAITPEQFALQELHAEEQQRLVGILPNFYVSYTWTAPPLSAGQKFRLATRNVLDPGNLALVGTVAGVQQATNAFPGYGQGAAGYGRRYGADLGNLVAGTYLGGAILPSLLHQDPRYFYKGTGSLKSRLLYALSRSVITRGDNGHAQFNTSSIFGDLSAGALSNAYYPASDRQGTKLFLENGVLGIAGDAMNNVVQELILPRFTTRGKKPNPPSTHP